MNSSTHLRLDPILEFWIDAGIPDGGLSEQTGGETTAKKLQQLEETGFAMRHVDFDGRIAWRASPSMLDHLASLQRDAEAELSDEP